MAKFNSQTGSKFGARSKRGKDSNVELLRKGLTRKLDIDELFDEIAELEVKDRVSMKVKLLSFVLPRLAQVELSIEDVTVKEYLQMSESEQDSYIQSIQQ